MKMILRTTMPRSKSWRNRRGTGVWSFSPRYAKSCGWSVGMMASSVHDEGYSRSQSFSKSIMFSFNLEDTNIILV